MSFSSPKKTTVSSSLKNKFNNKKYESINYTNISNNYNKELDYKSSDNNEYKYKDKNSGYSFNAGSNNYNHNSSNNNSKLWSAIAPLVDELFQSTEAATFNEQYEMSDGTLLDKINPYKYYKGIDVSQWQGDIDWEAVAPNIDYAILRLGVTYESGTLALDDKFLYNIKECNRLGIPVGIYYFSRALDENKNEEEIQFILDSIKDYDIDLPIYRDLEEDCEDQLDSGDYGRNMQINLTKTFCDKLKKSGYLGGLYINNRYSNSIPEIKGKYPVWTAGGLYYSGEHNNIDFDDMVYGYTYNDDKTDIVKIDVNSDISNFQTTSVGNASSVGITENNYVDFNFFDKETMDSILNHSNVDK